MKNPQPIRPIRIPCETLENRRLLSATISFAPHVDFVAGTSNSALVAADFNGDGNEDLAVADKSTNKVSIFFGNGGGSFTAGPVLSLGSTPVSLITGDLNGDGKPDLIVGGTATANQSTTTVTTFLNAGGGTFGLGQITTVETSATVNEPVGITDGDFNGDGKLDVAVTDYTSEQISILIGNGQGTFATPDNYQSDAHPIAIAEADFNDDGYPDLAVTSTISDLSSGTINNQVSLLLGSSTGDFSAGPNIQVSTAGLPDSVTTANLTVATSPGLVVGNSNGTATLVSNTDGTFAESATGSLAGGATGLAAGDFNLDGDVDLVASDGNATSGASANSVTVLPGLGSGTISGPLDFSTGTEPADIVVADFNNDGKPDIATANEGGGTVSILINNTDIPLVSTKTVATVSAASTPAGSEVDITATVTGSSTSPLLGESLPTGTVNFYDGTALLGSAAIATGTDQAVFATSSLTIGSHKLKAAYQADTAYASSTSTAVAETITPTSTQGPDLVGTFVSTTFPATVVPGETGSVTIKITNQGNTQATGTISNTVYLSLDNLLDNADSQLNVKGGLAHQRVNLKPDQSVTVSGTVTIPVGAPISSYLFVIRLNATSSLAESVSSNNLVVSPDAYQISDQFGNVAGRGGLSLQLSDDQGHTGIFKLTGPGTGTLDVGDNGIDLLLNGTAANTTLTITTKGSSFSLHDVTADSAIGTIKATGVAVGGAVILPGGAATIALQTLGTTMSIGAGAQTSLTVTTVNDLALTAAGPLKSLSVGSWTSGSITATWIGTLKSRQNFGASLNLSGAGAPAATLNTVTVGGTLGSRTGTWAIAGNTNKITAVSVASQWTLDSSALKSFTSGGDLDDTTITATTSIGTLKVLGQMAGSTVSGGSSIASIFVQKAVDSATRFIASAFPKRAVIDGAAIDPTADSRFEN